MEKRFLVVWQSNISFLIFLWIHENKLNMKCFTSITLHPPTELLCYFFTPRQSSAWSYVMFNYDVAWRKNIQCNFKHLSHKWYSPYNDINVIYIHMRFAISLFILYTSQKGSCASFTILFVKSISFIKS